jgi:hypothetical protein
VTPGIQECGWLYIAVRTRDDTRQEREDPAGERVRAPRAAPFMSFANRRAAGMHATAVDIWAQRRIASNSIASHRTTTPCHENPKPPGTLIPKKRKLLLLPLPLLLYSSAGVVVGLGTTTPSTTSFQRATPFRLRVPFRHRTLHTDVTPLFIPLQVYVADRIVVPIF